MSSYQTKRPLGVAMVASFWQQRTLSLAEYRRQSTSFVAHVFYMGLGSRHLNSVTASRKSCVPARYTAREGWGLLARFYAVGVEFCARGSQGGDARREPVGDCLAECRLDGAELFVPPGVGAGRVGENVAPQRVGAAEAVVQGPRQSLERRDGLRLAGGNAHDHEPGGRVHVLERPVVDLEGSLGVEAQGPWGGHVGYGPPRDARSIPRHAPNPGGVARAVRKAGATWRAQSSMERRAVA